MAKFEHPRVTYAINRNKRKVQELIEDMAKTISPDENMKKLLNEKEVLAKEHCAKDKKGRPLFKTVQSDETGESVTIYDIPDQNNENSPYRKELDKLEKKHEEALKVQRDKEQKYRDLLDDESDFKPFMLKLDVLEAHEKCPQEVMDLIHWMIED